MSFPRRVVPGQIYLITRRCARRCFFLKPTRRMNQIVRYCLALAAQACGIELHAVIVLSNHYHWVLTDVEGRLPEFMHRLDTLIARAGNALLGRGENFWAPGSYSAVELLDGAAVLDKIVYVICNAVAAGLVSRPEKWPGLGTTAKDLGRRFRAERPDFFFRDKGKGALPEEASFTITQPPAFDHWSPAQYREQLERLVGVRLQEIRNKRRAEGKTKYLGRDAIMRQDPFDRPGGTAPKRRLNPRIACKGRERRIFELLTLKAWRQLYQQMRQRWCAGDRDVIFPAGTYWMRLALGVACLPVAPG